MMSHFFENHIRKTSHRSLSTKIEHSLAQVELERTRRQLTSLRQKFGVVTFDTHCHVSGRLLKEGAPFAVYPNGVVCQIQYAESRQVCPVTGEDFSLNITS